MQFPGCKNAPKYIYTWGSTLVPAGGADNAPHDCLGWILEAYF